MFAPMAISGRSPKIVLRGPVAQAAEPLALDGEMGIETFPAHLCRPPDARQDGS